MNFKKILLAAFLFASINAYALIGIFYYSIAPSTSCPYGTALSDGCPGSPAGTPQLPHLLDTQQVTALNILRGTGYSNGTYTWTTSGGGGSGATGSVTVSGGYLGGVNGQTYTITNQGSGYTSRPTISVPAGAGAGSGGSITPTVYQATPHNAGTTWNMPGVDYYVGIPAGTVLRDPTTGGIMPSGASYSGGTVTVTGCNVTLDKFDFTLHNTLVVVNVSSSNCTTTIQNSKQHAFSTLYPIAQLSKLGSNGTFVYQFNEYDGLAPYGTNGGSGFGINNPIDDSYLGEVHNVALYYNYLHNFDAKIIQSSGATTGSTSLTEKYNLFSNFGSCGNSCAHGEAEYMYSGSSTTMSFTGEFNTYVLPFYYNTDLTTSNLTAPHAVLANNMTITGTTDDHNVVLAQGPQGTCASNNANPYVAAAAIYDGSQNGTNNAYMNNVTFDHNYVDDSGTYFVWYHSVGAGNTNVTWTNNIDAGAGGACN